MRALGIVGVAIGTAILYMGITSREISLPRTIPEHDGSEKMTAPSMPSIAEEKKSRLPASAPAQKTPLAAVIEQPREQHPMPVLEGWKSAKATVFWIGEEETDENDHIANDKSAWDGAWEAHFGGYDSPHDRCGFRPCGFTPQENPFYLALPYNDLDAFGVRKANAVRIPWNVPTSKTSVLKNRWVAIRAEGGTICFGQWEDVGPFEEDDVEYVFGGAPARNTFGVGAGIDVSPALSDCLSVGGIAEVSWRHVEASDVPEGPWKQVVTRTRATQSPE